MDMMNGLFDIASPNFEQMLRNDKSMPRSKESIMEDMQFLQDQRSPRKMGISHQCDMEIEEVIKRRTEKYRRHDEYRKKIAAEGFCDPFPDEANDILYDPAPVNKGLSLQEAKSPFDDDDSDDSDINDHNVTQTFVSEVNLAGPSNTSISEREELRKVQL
ncbi:uncharacterized protein LOC111707201 [Eurytemora carolleeae]|uniref:uncharacterized protein LOC111707201 n=1 Tax=Eurytemora carolleeae TaxID=1294199 RepID=UPI000C781A30|nr:uncharacterized protein LOC111707201 [Eurytemora carolleeae]|eukprot:XP_023336024.1 uncharacterized protein LOC111707201 [Eurytemora affinis]